MFVMLILSFNLNLHIILLSDLLCNLVDNGIYSLSPYLEMKATTQLFSLPFRKTKQTYEINPPDQLHNVVYLGNVLTIMAKGDQSVERPLSAIWRSYSTRKRDVAMKLSVTRQGLKVETKTLG